MDTFREDDDHPAADDLESFRRIRNNTQRDLENTFDKNHRTRENVRSYLSLNMVNYAVYNLFFCEFQDFPF